MHLPVYDERGGAFARLRNRRVLLYWPHGLGDFVHLGFVLPLLEPSNSYYVTRFGDDFVHLYDGCEYAEPLYSGVALPGDGSLMGARHLGLNFKKIRNRMTPMHVPEPLRAHVERARIDTVLYTDYPEREGTLPFPFHTKARALARDLVTRERLATLPLNAPLQSGLTFTAPPDVTARIEECLRAFVEKGDALVIVAAGGHTNPRKRWPDEHVRAFALALRERNGRSKVIAVDERTSSQIGREPGIAPTTQDLFGDRSLPFAHVLTTLIRASGGFVGVASGPLHAALAIGGRPIVGIWLAHYPDWYDESHEGSVHLVGPYPYEKRMDCRKATTTLPLSLRARVVPFPDRIPNADDAVRALASILPDSVRK
ncbi:MAG: hypothetical protein ABI282_06740 [Candidatus Baltobacteraceae bacterium]